MPPSFDLTELAWRIDELLSDSKARARFLAQSQAFIRLHLKNRERLEPLPFPSEDYPLFGDAPEIQLCEEYAILAAFHAKRCEQRRHVNPAPCSGVDDNSKNFDAKSPEFRTWLIWHNLLSDAGNLTGADLPHLLGCLHSVEADLNSVRSSTPSKNGGSGSKSNAEVRRRERSHARGTTKVDLPCPPPPVLSAPQRETLVIDNPNDSRDKFIYENLVRGKTRAWIKNRLKKSWEQLDSEQGISAAAKRYADRHKRPWPIARTSS